LAANIGDILIRTGVLSRADIEEAVGWQVLYGDRIGTNLLELGLITEESLASTLGKQLGCEWACGELELDPKLVPMVPAAIARRNEVVPWRIDGRKLRMLCISPGENIALFDEIGHRLGKVVKPVVAPEFRVHQLLRRHYGSTRQLRSLDFGIQPRERTGIIKTSGPQLPAEDLMDDSAFSEMYERGAAGRAVAGLIGQPPRWSGSEPPPARKPTLIRPPAVSPEQFERGPAEVPRETIPPVSQRPAEKDPESLAPEEAAALIELREIVEEVEPTAPQPASRPAAITEPPSLPASETNERTSLLLRPSTVSVPRVEADSLPSIVPAVSLAPPVAITPPLGAVAAKPPTHDSGPSFGPISDPPSMAAAPAHPPSDPAAPEPSFLTKELDAYVDSIQAEQWDVELGDIEELVLSGKHPVPSPPDMSPLSFEEALAAIARATDRNEVARSVLRYARSQAARAMLLSVQGDVALGWDAAGENLDQEVARAVALPLTVPSAFRLVRASRSHYLGPLAKETGNIRFLKDAGKQWPASAVLLPILFRGRVVYILYVDNGHKKFANANVGELMLLSQHITRSVEEMIARRQSSAAA
jgi:hypothetical protein